MRPEASIRSDESKGLLLGLVGVVIFATSLPMTRVAVGDASDPQLSPMFVTVGRAAMAGLLSLVYLMLTRAKLPPRKLWACMFVSGLGTVIGFPIFLALALRDLHAMHAAVVTGILPLATAVCGCLYFRQRPSLSFWACAVAGCTLVVAFAVYKGGGGITPGNWLLLAAMLSAAIGYIAGAKASAVIPASQVICWILVAALVPMLVGCMLYWPQGSVIWQSWGGVAYLGVFPMWLGFFAWYRGLALGGAVRVSQVQLVQPFIALICAVLIAGESLDTATVLFALLVIGVVYLGKKAPVN
jgi:drug/metabolite transporter (DMT)-like permease